MSGRIVVGVIHTSAGERALSWAAQRAAALGSGLLLVSVVDGVVGAVGEGSVLTDALRGAKEWLEDHAASIRESGVAVETAVVRGDPKTQLAEASTGESLLVIGSDSRARKKNKRRGVNGIRIVAGASCPVAVVPDVDTSRRVGVVVGVDGSPVSEMAIAFAAAEADRWREPLIAVSVWTPLAAPGNVAVYPDEYLRAMQTTAEEALAVSLAGLRQDYPDLEIVARAERGYPAEVINELASSARLAVVGSHGRGPVARFLLGSISHRVLADLATVVAVVR